MFTSIVHVFSTIEGSAGYRGRLCRGVQLEVAFKVAASIFQTATMTMKDLCAEIDFFDLRESFDRLPVAKLWEVIVQCFGIFEEFGGDRNVGSLFEL